MTPFERRVARLETERLAALERPAPLQLFVGVNETHAEARARFAAEWPNREPGHCVMLLPAKPRTQADEEVFEQRLYAQQSALVGEARSARLTAAKPVAPIAAPRWSTSPVIRPRVPHIVWKPNA